MRVKFNRFLVKENLFRKDVLYFENVSIRSERVMIQW
jgi:hypothetical protein